MARTPISDRPIVSQWLIASRKRFTNPETKRPWSAEFFLKQAKAAGVWVPNISNYAQWESGVVDPKPENLRPVIEFYTGLGVDGPSAPPKPTPAPDLATALLALTAELAAWRTERQELLERVADLGAQVAELVADHAGLESGVRAALDAHPGSE